MKGFILSKIQIVKGVSHCMGPEIYFLPYSFVKDYKKLLS
jgi:hypothetical protein